MNKYILTVFIFFNIFALSFCQTVENLGANINTTYNEFSPVISPDGKSLYFLREGHPNNKSKEKYSCDVWKADLVGNIWQQAIHLSNPFNGNVSNSIYSISPDGNTIITNWSEDTQALNITKGFGIIKKTEAGFTKAEKLDIPKFDKMCKGRFQFGSLSADGKTFLMSFSDSKNGVIDDIYASFLEKDGNWTEPMNLGDDINTNDTECIPFLHTDGYTLYFSSNRAGGLGSNDIYMSKRLDRSWQKWSKPKNMGPVVNSEDYDAFFSLSPVDEYAYFVTKKSSLGKNDIVKVKLSEIVTDEKDLPASNVPVAALGGAKKDNKNGKGVDQIENKGLKNVMVISGKLIDAKTLKIPIGGQVIYEDLSNGQELGFATPDPVTGIYKIELPYGKKYSITPVGKGFVGSGFTMDLTSMVGSKYLEVNGKDLKLIPAETGQKITLNNIFFQFAKTELRTESFSELNRLAEFLETNNTMQVEISGHTDSIGSDEANNRISQGRADAVKSYLTTTGKIAGNRIVTKGYGKTRPIATNETEEGQQTNRRVEFTIL